MPNRLARETSPYLRQHADNPVDWYPWGDEAFAAARQRDRPILLSVGYSSCHWCHVMAHESFEHEPTAQQMNELFINVKVDREERPDVDAIYMEAVQAMTGHGGWPMTVFLLPDGKPFFGGTYFPRTARGGMLSFTDLMSRIDEVWRTRRDDLVAQSDELTETIGRTGQLAAADAVPGPELVAQAVAALKDQHDPEWGGFGNAPKFPQTMSLDLLLRHHVATGDQAALDIVTTSLDAMASGGIYDHLGGGFSRYSVDREWLVPHFEKMLYDQALIARIYLHGWKVTRKPEYLDVLAETVAYVLRDLRDPSGGFYSAEDADSEGVEGKFYVWSLAEVRDVLARNGDGHADGAIDWYGVTEGGNFEGSTILTRPVRGDLLRPAEIEQARQALFERRATRIRPGLDDKVLTEWNALWITTLAEAAAATGMGDWLVAAVEGAHFLLGNLRRPDGRWRRAWHPDAAAASVSGTAADTDNAHLAVAADYGALVEAFVRLAEATGDPRWITEARTTADAMIELFWDDDQGGLFSTGHDAPALITRPKDIMDNAVPGANSLAANGLLRLAALTGDTSYEQRAASILRLVGDMAARHPTAFGHLLAAVDLYGTGATEIAVVGDRPDLVDAVAERYLPNAVIAWGEPFASPLWDGRNAGPDDAGQAYVCRNYACQAPVSGVEDLISELS